VRTDHEAEVAHDEMVRRADTEDVVVIEKVAIDDGSRVTRRALRLRVTSLASVVGLDVAEVRLHHRRWRLQAIPGHNGVFCGGQNVWSGAQYR